METPVAGIASVTETVNGVEISIPARRNWFIIIFMGAWLGGWALGEAAAAGALFGIFDEVPLPFKVFISFWLVAWTVGGAAAVRLLVWTLKGKEVITVTRGLLTLEKKGFLMGAPKMYDLEKATHFRVEDKYANVNSPVNVRQFDLSGIIGGGTICFNYGMGTIKFAAGMEGVEAESLLKVLRAKKLLTDKNFEEKSPEPGHLL